MKLFYSALSPYVRKVLVFAHETGQADDIERLPAAAHPIDRDQSIVAVNPTGKVPTAFADDGQALYDSRVICQYLDDRHGGEKLYPGGERRWPVLTLEALGEGVLDAAVAARYEGAVRPEELRWDDWQNSLMAKIDSSLDLMTQRLDEYRDEVHAGSIAIGCALGYIDLRFPDHDWRSGRTALADWYRGFAARESMRATAPE